MAETLNLSCLCSTLQPQLLQLELDSRLGLEGTARDFAVDRPHLFSASPVFISVRDFEVLANSVSALHRISGLPDYQASALQRVAPAAAACRGPQGVFMGYDFHMGVDGPRLIEINTNAGGAFLHAAAARAHRSCCEPMHRMFHVPAALDQLDEVFVAMFRSEWKAQRGDATLRTIAIVDDDPATQYLAPEFGLARALFLTHGIAAVIADPRELEWRDGALWHPLLPAGLPVDLVYNRLTDFDLSLPAHAALHSAYASGGAVVTPHPRAHALHADKRNLVTLSDDGMLASWGVPQQDRELLHAVVPRSQRVTAQNADALWAQRRGLFFKPAGGYGSRAAYRGDKLTRRVWAEIVAGNFIAQEFVPASERLVNVGGLPTRLKLDVRAYAYAGAIQLLAARTYAGQTTNFRTAGGGFSPVVILPDIASSAVGLEPHPRREANTVLRDQVEFRVVGQTHEITRPVVAHG